MKRRFRNATLTWYNFYGNKMHEEGKIDDAANPFEDLGGVLSYLDSEPLVFANE
jgi:hypothetical protein